MWGAITWKPKEFLLGFHSISAADYLVTSCTATRHLGESSLEQSLAGLGGSRVSELLTSSSPG